MGQHGREIGLKVARTVEMIIEKVVGHHLVVHGHLMVVHLVHSVLLDVVDMVVVGRNIVGIVPAVLLPHLPVLFRRPNVAIHGLCLGHCGLN